PPKRRDHRGGRMSVIAIGRMAADPANVERLWRERKGDFEASSEAARAAGATHRRWAFGDGFVTIIDEWPDAQAFDSFFNGQPRIADLMQEAQVQGPPQFDILEAKTAPDE